MDRRFYEVKSAEFSGRGKREQAAESPRDGAAITVSSSAREQRAASSPETRNNASPYDLLMVQVR